MKSNDAFFNSPGFGYRLIHSDLYVLYFGNCGRVVALGYGLASRNSLEIDWSVFGWRSETVHNV